MASIGTITIPVKMRTATARVSISSTSCSVTCGMGYKVEETCQIGPNGERRYCDIQKVECLTNWLCGMLHFTILVGKPFEFQCLSPTEIGPEINSFSYSWRIARGIITTDDALFKPFKTTGFVIKLSPAMEYDAGTYRCDVQFMRTYKIVKRIYFGIRVIPGHLVDLNFDKSLTLEQHLASERGKPQQNATSVPVQQQQHFWRQRTLFVFLIGIGSGVVGGILLHIFYYLVKVPNNYGYVEE